ncbi:MAG: ribonuclease HII [Bacteriovoracaceae bacterium]|nr:ribonuclease HII [Bacteriovoracaceae bacterium]
MTFESKYISDYPCLLIATDEAGRGPLAGPVVAGAVALKIQSSKELNELVKKLRALGVNDSKKLSKIKREEIRSKKFSELKSSWVELSAREIDEINILQASLKSMKLAAEKLVSSSNKLPVIWLIDGNRSPKDANSNWRVHPIVKGDSKSVFIGLASVIAKVERDQIMEGLHEKFPQYGFNKHAGYPTLMHREAIIEHGPAEIHRKTFKGVKEYF